MTKPTIKSMVDFLKSKNQTGSIYGRSVTVGNLDYGFNEDFSCITYIYCRSDHEDLQKWNPVQEMERVQKHLIGEVRDQIKRDLIENLIDKEMEKIFLVESVMDS